MQVSTADLYDLNSSQVTVADSLFRNYGNRHDFHGVIYTLDVFEDFGLIKKTLQSPGNNRVLVIDGKGSLRCAMLGDKLATMAIDNNWSGIVINGCIRDAAVISNLNLGVKALNTSPVKPALQGSGEANTIVEFAGVKFIPGHYLYADADGILLAEQSLEN